MKKQLFIWNTELPEEIKIYSCRKARVRFSGDALAELSRDKIRFILPTLPRRKPCVTRRALLAAMREAELAEWQASGGDYLHAMHQPVA
jgi:hypothetical protein